MRVSSNLAINLLTISRVICFIIIGVNWSSAQSLSGINVSIEADNEPLQVVIKELEKQSGISFSYNPRKIPINSLVSYTAQNRPLKTVLGEIFNELDISFTSLENQIILSKKKKNINQSAKVNTLSGYVKDQNNGEALIGTTILVADPKMGAVSNQYGFYSLSLPSGDYDITFAFIGYDAITKTVDLSYSQKLDISLQEAPPILESIVVTSSISDEIDRIQLGRTNLRPQQIEERSALFGENDVIKSLESIPGIKPHSDGSTFYYVRGGNRDQNLILLDDAPIYNPSHALGLFSTIIPDAINDISIYKGEMPAALGGRLSSIMDIRTKKGNDQNLSIWGSTGFISTKLGVEGPIKKNESSYLVSGRLSQIGWIFKLDNEEVDQVYFADFTSKLNFKLSEKNSIFFSLYTGSDNYFGPDNGIEWSNTAGTFRWTHLFSDKMFLKSTIAASTYDYFLHQDRSNNTVWKSHISNFTLKTDFNYFFNPDSELTFGAGLNGYNINPGNLTTDAPIIPPVVSIRNSAELILYGNHEVKIDEHWGLNYGLRISSWSNIGESFEYVFDEDREPIDTLFFEEGDNYSNYINAEPRIALSYQLSDNSSLKASFSRNIQNLHLITNSISPFTSLEVWLPSNINIKPQASNQFGLGYFHQFPLKGMSLEVEVFHKDMTNQIDYEAHAETLLNPFVERELRFGKGTSSGIELITKKNEGRLRGWVGYSYSRARRKFDEVNGGKTFNAFFDRPHEINLVANYDLNLRWQVGMNWSYFTGAPFSAPISFYKFNDQEVPVYGQKNNERLPDYQRLDLSASLRLNKNVSNRFRHDLSFSIYNFFGRKNPIFINYNKTPVGDNRYDVPINLLEKTRAPSQVFLFQFIPSITYNFKWQ